MTGTQNQNGHSKNGFPVLKGVDHIELYVGNAYQAAHFYRAAFGFQPIAHAGLETGVRDRVSFVMAQNNIRLVLTSAQQPDGPIAEHVQVHGDGVKDVAFLVDDVKATFDKVIAKGATSVSEPATVEDENGVTVKATIKAFGDTVHSFVQRDEFKGTFWRDYRALDEAPSIKPTGLMDVDHIAVSTEKGMLSELVDFYEDVLGFHESHQENVVTEYSAMNSKVVEDSSGRIKFPIVEPAPGKGKSQIDEYLSYYRGSGVQHIALLSDNIVSSVRALRENYIEFMRTPSTYYDLVPERMGDLEIDVEPLRELGILVDRDEWGHLMQTFTKPLHSRPTIFFEIIERQNARGFGAGNIKALFKALEQEQLQRGNL